MGEYLGGGDCYVFSKRGAFSKGLSKRAGIDGLEGFWRVCGGWDGFHGGR